MITPPEANHLLRRLLDAFPEKHFSEAILLQLRDFFVQLPHPRPVVERMVEEARQLEKWPSPREMTRMCERTKPPSKQDERFWEAVEDRFSRYGNRFLAMSAHPYDDICPSCSDRYTPRGIPADDPLLEHRHFDLARLHADAPLDMAVVIAQTYTDTKPRHKRDDAPWHPLREKVTQEPPPEILQKERLERRLRFRSMKRLLKKAGLALEQEGR